MGAYTKIGLMRWVEPGTTGENGPMRTAITPGKLYWLLSREFHERRPDHCSACRMPLPELIEEEAGAANWSPGGLPPVCPACAPVIEEIIARHQAEYDIFDPVSRPRRPAGHEGPQGNARLH